MSLAVNNEKITKITWHHVIYDVTSIGIINTEVIIATVVKPDGDNRAQKTL